MPSLRWRALLVLTLGFLTLCASPAAWSAPPSRPIQGVWLSPEWIVPGTTRYDEASARAVVRTTMAALKRLNINTVFVETLVRGTSVAGGDALPVYPHLRWRYDQRGQQPIDLLQLIIDEGARNDIAVHAWVHMFYWRMDNDDVFKPWQRAPSIWDDLLVGWLSQQRDRLGREQRLPRLRQAIEQTCASIRAGGVDAAEISRILTDAGLESDGRPIGRLVSTLLAAGCPPPDFLLMGSADDPFPRTSKRSLRPIYLDPASPRVRQRIIAAVTAISKSHPDLAGVQLDHVRFPVEAQGIPGDLETQGREAIYFNRALPSMAARYDRLRALIERRRNVLTEMVNEIATRLYRGQQLSAAVLPLYYVERSDGVDRFNGYDYAAQDWHAWKVDFVVPMMYGFDPWRIRTLVRRFSAEAQAAAGASAAPLVVPGVSRLKMAQSGLLGNDDFVYFDLTLGLDLRYEKDHEEDYTWKPRRP